LAVKESQYSFIRLETGGKGRNGEKREEMMKVGAY